MSRRENEMDAMNRHIREGMAHNNARVRRERENQGEQEPVRYDGERIHNILREQRERHRARQGENQGRQGTPNQNNQNTDGTQTINSLNVMGDEYTLVNWKGLGYEDVLSSFLVKTTILNQLGLNTRETNYNLNEMSEEVLNAISTLVQSGSSDVIVINSVDIERIEL